MCKRMVQEKREKGERERESACERPSLCVSEWMGIEPHWKLHRKNTGYTNTIIVYYTDKSGREKREEKKRETEKFLFLFTLFSFII